MSDDAERPYALDKGERRQVLAAILSLTAAVSGWLLLFRAADRALRGASQHYMALGDVNVMAGASWDRTRVYLALGIFDLFIALILGIWAFRKNRSTRRARAKDGRSNALVVMGMATSVGGLAVLALPLCVFALFVAFL